MTEQAQAHEHPNYMAIFFALAILTAVEVGWAMIPIGKLMIIGGLILLAVVKAVLVAMYFMHVKFEGRWIYIILVPSLILAGVLIFALYADIGWKVWN